MVTYYATNSGLMPVTTLNKATWISAVNPTDAEKQFLLGELKIPEAFYNDMEDMDERPRLEHEDGWQLIILRIPYKSTDARLPYNTAPLGTVFKGDVFVSICFAENDLLPDFVAYTQRKNITPQDHYHLVLRLLLSSGIWFQKYIKQISQLIKAAEDSLEKSIRNEDLQALLQIEKVPGIFHYIAKR